MTQSHGSGDLRWEGRDDVAISPLLIVVPTLLAVATMLVVRRWAAPAGGLMSSMESADGIFSAAGPGLAVLLAFVIFTTFNSYENGRNATGQEAVAAQQMYQTAGFFPDKTQALRGDVICYGAR